MQLMVVPRKGRPESLPPPSKYPHGTRARYVTGCRCDDCRESNRLAYHENQRKALEAVAELEVTPATGPAPQVWTAPDGTKRVRNYKRACPGVNGEPCIKGSHLRVNSIGGICARCRQRLIFNGLVDATQAREHILMLGRQGVGYKQVAEAGQIAVSVVGSIRSGKKTRIRKATQDKILGVDLSARADKAFVVAGPTMAIVKKLLKKGLSRTEIARRMGSKGKTPALQLKGPRVTLRNAHKMQKVWEAVLEEERVEAEILKEMKHFCTDCGHSHAKRNRQRILKGVLPATSKVIKELYPCFYDGGKGTAEEQRLIRDLHDIGAVKEGERNGLGPWVLPGTRRSL